MSKKAVINLGTKENPIWVSRAVVEKPNFWDSVASGSTIVSDQAMAQLLPNRDGKSKKTKKH